MSSPNYESPTASPDSTAAAGEGEHEESAAGTSSGISAWVKYQDDEGRDYYYNSVTDATQWEQPDDFDESAAVAAVSEPATEESGDGVTGRTEEDQATATPTGPDSEQGGSTPVGSPTPSQDGSGTPCKTPEPASTPLGDEGGEGQTPPIDGEGTEAHQDNGDEPVWAKYQDDEGRDYYFNAVTQETQWERPDGFASPPMNEVQGQMDSTANDVEMETTEPQTDHSTKDKEVPDTTMTDPTKIDNLEKEATDIPEEKQPSPEIEIDTREPHEIAQDTLSKPDAIVEYTHKELWGHIEEVIKVSGQEKGTGIVMNCLVDNYVSQPAICGLLASWLSKLKASNKANSNNSANTKSAATKNSSSSSPTKGSKSEMCDASIANSIRSLMEQVITKQAQVKFTKSVGDAFLQNFTEEEAKFLDTMMKHPNWRRLLIDLSASSSNKDSSLLGYCLSEISKKGHHREIAKRIDLSDYFEVFHRMFKSELCALGCRGDNNSENSNEGSTTMTQNASDVVKNLLRTTCTSTEYTYLYSLEVLDELIAKGKGKKVSAGQENSLRAKIRIWQRLREELKEHMIKPSANASTNALTRKRRADLALTVSELHQRQRRRYDPSDPEHQSSSTANSSSMFMGNNAAEKRRYSIDSGIIGLLKKYSMGLSIDDGLAEQLLHNPEEEELPDDDETGGRLGQLLIGHPLAVKALLQTLFHPTLGTAKTKSLEMKLKTSKLIAIAILASQKNVLSELNSGSEDDEKKQKFQENKSELGKAILRGSELVEKVQNMVSFVATEDVSEKGGSSVGQELSSLCIKYAPVGHGFLLWAKSYCDGDEFAGSAAFETLTPGILSLARIIAKNHPLTRPEVLDISLMFLKHSNSELSYQKMKTLKEQCLRLLLSLTTQGLAVNVYNFIGVALKEGRSSGIDPYLFRYFVGGALTIIRPPVSVPFVRSMGTVLSTKAAITALNTEYFDAKNKIALAKLIGFFGDAVVEENSKFSRATANDRALVSKLKGAYVKESLSKVLSVMK